MKTAIFALLLVSSLGASDGFITVNYIPRDNPSVPAYIRVYAHEDAEYVAFWFWRVPGCVPATYVVLDFFDFTPGVRPGTIRADDCPLAVNGWSVYDGSSDPASGRAPLATHLEGTNSVQVLLAPMKELLPLGRRYTFQQLMALPGKVMGLARHYSEDLSPDPGPGGGGSKNGWIKITADGMLFDGRTFEFEADSVGNVCRLKLTEPGKISGTSRPALSSSSPVRLTAPGWSGSRAWR